MKKQLLIAGVLLSISTYFGFAQSYYGNRGIVPYERRPMPQSNGGMVPYEGDRLGSGRELPSPDDYRTESSRSVFVDTKVNNAINVNGFFVAEKAYFGSSVTARSSADIKKSEFKGDFKVMGSLNAERVTFNNVDVNGSAMLNDLTIKGSLTIYGSVFLNDSEVKGTVTLNGSLFIDDAEVKDVIIQQGSLTLYKAETRTITVNAPGATINISDSTVKGDIRFSQPGGKVILMGSSKVHGKVINGTIMRQ